MIKVLLLDMDGVLTDGTYSVNDQGVYSRVFNTRDFHGMSLLSRKGIKIGVITGSAQINGIHQMENSASFAEFFHEAKKKVDIIMENFINKGIQWKEIAYIGDDLPDQEVLTYVGIPVCPADAESSIRKIVTDRKGIILKRSGGKGCVREFINMLIKKLDS